MLKILFDVLFAFLEVGKIPDGKKACPPKKQYPSQYDLILLCRLY